MIMSLALFGDCVALLETWSLFSLVNYDNQCLSFEKSGSSVLFLALLMCTCFLCFIDLQSFFIQLNINHG